MSQLNGSADISRYFLQKNRYFVEHYYVQGSIGIEAAVISYRDFFFWIWSFDVHPGMGQTIDNIVFDPIDINYGIMPIFEFHVPHLILQNGIDHRCFHEVDRQNFYPIYHNMFFFLVGSPHFRLESMRRALQSESWRHLSSRMQWYVKWGYFIREFFGLIDPIMLNDVADNVTNIHEAAADTRFTFYRNKALALIARGSTLLGQAEVVRNGKKRIELYWRQEVSLEGMPLFSKYGALVFVKYIRDHFPPVVVRSNPSSYRPGSLMPRLSRDGLLQLGVGYFF